MTKMFALGMTQTHGKTLKSLKMSTTMESQVKTQHTLRKTMEINQQYKSTGMG